jgi:endonuclease I
MPFHALNAKHYLNIFTKHQFNGGIARKKFYFLPRYEHAFHMQFYLLIEQKEKNEPIQ